MITRRLTQVFRLVAKEWRLLLRNPHGLAAVFLMPAIFVLVMSFTLKNTLLTKVNIPVIGWLMEDKGPAANQWTAEWLERNKGLRFETREALLLALKTQSR
jgi:ABC-2 type transport system permease protein